VPAPSDDEVEAVAVAIRLGDSEAQTGRFVGKGQFGQFSLAFSGAMGWFLGAAGCEVFPETNFGLLFHGQIRKGASG
jgi:hypothetical protein